MTLVQVRCALAVAQRGSFTRAAAACGLTQSSLSHAISQLEEELGVKLFVRTTRKVSTTPAGEQLLRSMEGLRQATAEVERLAATLRPGTRERVGVGVSPVVDAERVAKWVEDFANAHADIRIDLEELNLVDLRARLQNGQLDVVIAPAGAARTSRLQRRLYDDPLMFLPRGKEKGAARVAKLSDVASQKWLMVPDSCGLASTTRALFNSRRLPFAQARQRALGYHVLEQWSEAGLGAAILPASKVIRPVRAVPLVDERGRPVSLAIDASWLSRAAQTPATRTFIAHLKRMTQ